MISDRSTRLVTIHTKCTFCGIGDDVKVSQKGFENYFGKGMLIQKAFPDLTDDQREKILNGTCADCWDKYMIPRCKHCGGKIDDGCDCDEIFNNTKS